MRTHFFCPAVVLCRNGRSGTPSVVRTAHVTEEEARRTHLTACLLAIVATLAISCTGLPPAAAQAPELDDLVLLTPGSSQSRSVEIEGRPDRGTLTNIEGLLVITTGEASELAITVFSDAADGDNPLLLSYLLAGVGYSPGAGFTIINEFAMIPEDITTFVPIGASVGFAVVGLAITPLLRDIETPVQFIIEFSLG